MRRLLAFLIVALAIGMVTVGVWQLVRETPPTPQICLAYPLPDDGDAPLRSVLSAYKRWPNGSTLRVKNIDCPPATFASLMEDGREWCQYANLNVRESFDANAEIRISGTRPGAWSMIGTDARTIAVGQPTMNVSAYSRSTGRHEWGHALGLEHEHRRWDRPWTWNLANLYSDHAAVGWNKAMVDAQIIAVLDKTQTWQTPFDRTSIMQYPISPRWTLEGVGVGWNTELSARDKELAALAYPGRWTPPKVLPPPDPRIAINQQVLAAARSAYAAPPPPGFLSWGIASEADINGDGFRDVTAHLVQRVGNRHRVWTIKIDGAKPPFTLLSPFTFVDR